MHVGLEILLQPLWTIKPATILLLTTRVHIPPSWKMHLSRPGHIQVSFHYCIKLKFMTSSKAGSSTKEAPRIQLLGYCVPYDLNTSKSNRPIILNNPANKQQWDGHRITAIDTHVYKGQGTTGSQWFRNTDSQHAVHFLISSQSNFLGITLYSSWFHLLDSRLPSKKSFFFSKKWLMSVAK